MKFTIYTMAIAISAGFVHNPACAQGLAVNTTGSAAAASAIVDMASTTQGMLAPRMLAAEKTAISTPAAGLLIYQLDGASGFYYYNGATWVALSGAAGWGLTGNAGTVAGTSFLGTTDSVALRLKVNNKFAGELNPGTFNTSYGYKAGQVMTTGTFNTAAGQQSLATNADGTYNTATGYQAMYLNTSGNYNTAAGYRALSANTTGSSNTAIGFNTLTMNLTGSGNTATGNNSLSANLASNNTAYGNSSLARNTTGSKNTATGLESLTFNTTGTDNTASGYGSLTSNVSGIGNTATGSYSLFGNVSYYNTAYGSNSLMGNTSGSGNCATGAMCMEVNTTGGANTAMGYYSIHDNIAGTNNTAIGYSSLDNNLSSNNTAMGYMAMTTNTTGSNNTVIGASADVSTAALSNATALGYNARVTGSNMVRIGSTTVTSINGAVDFTVVSDGRFKSNVQEHVPGLAFIMKLRPVTYNLDVRKIDRFTGCADSTMQAQAAGYAKAEAIVRTGFIAQEVEQAAKDAGYDFDGVHKPQNDKDPYGIAYAEFTVPLVKAAQEQQLVIAELKMQVEELTRLVNEMKKGAQKN